MTLTRRFPSPWTAEDDGACFIVGDANRQAVAYVYYFDEESGAVYPSPRQQFLPA